MAYFVSDVVQQNLPSWALMPLPKALATAAQQAVASIVAMPSNQTRGGLASNPTAPGDKPSAGARSCGLTVRDLVKAGPGQYSSCKGPIGVNGTDLK